MPTPELTAALRAEWDEACYRAREGYTTDPHVHIEALIAAGDAVLAALSAPPPPDDGALAAELRIGDVVMYGGRLEPPRFLQITTNYECRKWESRRADITALLRPVWKRASSVPLPAPEEK